MKYPSNNIIYGNRGMTLEYLINSSNDYYRMVDKAIVYKKPTPITVARVNFPSRYEENPPRNVLLLFQLFIFITSVLSHALH